MAKGETGALPDASAAGRVFAQPLPVQLAQQEPAKSCASIGRPPFAGARPMHAQKSYWRVHLHIIDGAGQMGAPA